MARSIGRFSSPHREFILRLRGELNGEFRIPGLPPCPGIAFGSRAVRRLCSDHIQQGRLARGHQQVARQSGSSELVFRHHGNGNRQARVYFAGVCEGVRSLDHRERRGRLHERSEDDPRALPAFGVGVAVRRVARPAHERVDHGISAAAPAADRIEPAKAGGEGQGEAGRAAAEQRVRRQLRQCTRERERGGPPHFGLAWREGDGTFFHRLPSLNVAASPTGQACQKTTHGTGRTTATTRRRRASAPREGARPACWSRIPRSTRGLRATAQRAVDRGFDRYWWPSRTMRRRHAACYPRPRGRFGVPRPIWAVGPAHSRLE